MHRRYVTILRQGTADECTRVHTSVHECTREHTISQSLHAMPHGCLVPERRRSRPRPGSGTAPLRHRRLRLRLRCHSRQPSLELE